MGFCQCDKVCEAHKHQSETESGVSAKNVPKKLIFHPPVKLFIHIISLHLQFPSSVVSLTAGWSPHGFTLCLNFNAASENNINPV